jgi:hypothetical protein
MKRSYEEWKKRKTKAQNKKIVDTYLEKARQAEFAREQSRESVFTRPTESIVDADN